MLKGFDEQQGLHRPSLDDSGNLIRCKHNDQKKSAYVPERNNFVLLVHSQSSEAGAGGTEWVERPTIMREALAPPPA